MGMTDNGQRRYWGSTALRSNPAFQEPSPQGPHPLLGGSQTPGLRMAAPWGDLCQAQSPAKGRTNVGGATKEPRAQNVVVTPSGWTLTLGTSLISPWSPVPQPLSLHSPSQPFCHQPLASPKILMLLFCHLKTGGHKSHTVGAMTQRDKAQVAKTLLLFFF